ncbi:MAG: histidine phosphatase family protein [Acholeplasmatales bacterium]|jgi:broad specificity phosphatase PhoE|nr:histidine phosphatase family protein [Acholeplasmatales bacterium]
MKIYIVRHGQTNLNKAHVIQGKYNEPLNEEGIKMAQLTGESLKGITFDEAYSSPLNRSYETVKEILRCSNNNCTIKTDSRLEEVGFGSWEGKSFNNPLYKDILDDYFSNPIIKTGPSDAEDVNDVMKRTQEFLKELANRNDNKTYLVGSHAFAIRAMLNFLYEDKNDFWQGHGPKNLAINILEVKDGKITFIEKDKIYY